MSVAMLPQAFKSASTVSGRVLSTVPDEIMAPNALKGANAEPSIVTRLKEDLAEQGKKITLETVKMI